MSLGKQTDLWYQLWCVHVCVSWKGRGECYWNERFKNFPALFPEHRSCWEFPLLPQWKVPQHDHSEPQDYETQQVAEQQDTYLRGEGQVRTQDKQALFVFCQKDGIVMSCLLPRQELHSYTGRNDPSFLGAGVQTRDPRLGKEQTVICQFLGKWHYVRNTTSSCIKWEKCTILKVSHALFCLLPWKTLGRALGSTLRRAQKKSVESRLEISLVFPSNHGIGALLWKWLGGMLQCGWRVLLFSTESNSWLLSAFLGVDGKKTPPPTFTSTKWYLSNL